MSTSVHHMRSESAREAFLDVASIVAIVLVALVALVLANPRVGADLGRIWHHQGTQSTQAANTSAGK